MIRIVTTGILLLMVFIGFSQKDTTTEIHSQLDTIAISDKAYKHSPGLAVLLSAIVPGSGQIYNKKYWKPPIIWGGMVGLIYLNRDLNKSYTFYRDIYNAYRNPYLEKNETPPPNASIVVNKISLTPAYVRSQRDYYRRWRDITIIGMGVWYVLNMMDAYVDAHFFEYDISEDLTFSIKPQKETMIGLRYSVFKTPSKR